MKQVTKYQSEDGAMFDTLEAAEMRDRLVVRCAEIETTFMRPAPTRSDERVRQPRFAEFRDALWALIRERYPKDTPDRPADEIHPFSGVGRFICDAAPRCINRLWGRLQSSADGWEYEQPYFASNQGRFTGIDR